MDGQKIGEAIIAMGGGRTYTGQPIDHSVGLCFERPLGENVSRGEPIVRILCDNPQKAEYAARLLTEAIAIEESDRPGPELTGQQVAQRLWRDYPGDELQG
jgi:thymidine phosphorylase